MSKSFKIITAIIFFALSLFFLTHTVWAVDCPPDNCVAVGVTCPPNTKVDSAKTCATNFQCCLPSTTKPEAPATVPNEYKTDVNVSPLKTLGNTSVSVLIGRIVQAILSITGAIALLMVVYGAITLLISRGGEGVKKGKDILIWAAIGSIVVVGSYVLVDYAIKGIKGEGSAGTTAGEGVTDKNSEKTPEIISGDDCKNSDKCKCPEGMYCVDKTCTARCADIGCGFYTDPTCCVYSACKEIYNKSLPSVLTAPPSSDPVNTGSSCKILCIK